MFVIICICAIILLIYTCYYIYHISDFGESSINMDEDEYNEFCKENKKEWERKELERNWKE